MQKVYVDIIESERGWGRDLLETKEFESIQEATRFVVSYNSRNNKAIVPDYYTYAERPYMIETTKVKHYV